MASSTSLPLLLICVLYTCCSAQKSCQGRCGEEYDRGSKCQCDYECLVHKECCKNYVSLCTTGDSCKGRCGEVFRRGRQCHCDIECVKYNQCCPDYETQCTLEDTALKPENTAASPQRTTSLCLNAQSNKPTESSTEEDEPVETTEDNIASDGFQDLNDPDAEVVTDATPEAVSGNEPLPSDAPEEEQLDPIEIDATPLPDLAKVQPSETVNKTSEIEGDSLALPEQQSTPVPDTAISSSLPAASQTPTETAGINGPPTPDEDPESLPEGSGNEMLPLTSLAPAFPTEVASTDGPITTTTTTTQHPTDHSTDLIKPASEQPDQNSETTPPSTSETEDDPAIMNEPEKPEIIIPTTEPNPLNNVQPEETLDPEDNDKPQAENIQSELGKNTTLDGVETQDADPKDKPGTSETTTKSQEENIEDFSPTEPPTSPASLDLNAESVKLDPSPTKAQEKPSKPKEDSNQVFDEGNPRDYQSDANNDTNLCSGRPVNGLTMLKNGTIVVFRGHYFWTLNSRRYPGPAQGITDVWGVPSPIDTVYTRCNCQGKTYFFKGNNYWRFENGNMDPGFPKTISEGFGLRGQIVASLSMPKYRSRRESVFFFKRGGLAQRYTYNVVPQCGRNVATSTLRRVRRRRAAGITLGQEINISKSWYGFPSTITSAVSVPSKGGDGYKYYVFSPAKYYSLKMEGETPVILTPKGGREQQKSAKSWFRCPEN